MRAVWQTRGASSSRGASAAVARRPRPAPRHRRRRPPPNRTESHDPPAPRCRRARCGVAGAVLSPVRRHGARSRADALRRHLIGGATASALAIAPHALHTQPVEGSAVLDLGDSASTASSPASARTHSFLPMRVTSPRLVSSRRHRPLPGQVGSSWPIASSLATPTEMCVWMSFQTPDSRMAAPVRRVGTSVPSCSLNAGRSANQPTSPTA